MTANTNGYDGDMATTPLTTLAAAVDVLNEAQFYGRRLSRAEQDAAASFIASRQGVERAKAGSFGLTPAECAAGIRVFTGELMTHASARHIVGEECCRVLRNLKELSAEVKRALATASANMNEHILPHVDADGHPGMYCCGKCTVAFWRNIVAGGFNEQESRLDDGVEFLHKHRDGEGGWRRFPFYYTLLALSEMESPTAKAEIEYASDVIQVRLSRRPSNDMYAQRRHDVMRRALESL
jgi:hypothetical protein